MIREPLVAIVVPVFNTEKYVEECLDSIAGQEYNNFIVLMVNDGSTDHSLEVLEKFGIRNKNFILINKINGGVSSARNAALDFLDHFDEKPKYSCFIDSDDKIEKCYLKFFVSALEESNADYGVCSYAAFDRKGIRYNNNLPERSIMSRKDIIKQFFGIQKNRYFHKRGTAARSFFLNNRFFKYDKIKNVRFDEKIRSCEDQKYFIQLLKQLNLGICIPNILFLYRQRKSSASNINKLKSAKESLEVYKELLKSEWCDSRLLKKIVIRKILHYAWKIMKYDLSDRTSFIGSFNQCKDFYLKYIYCSSRIYPKRVILLLRGEQKTYSVLKPRVQKFYNKAEEDYFE